ncbi:MAG: CsbD family protein [Woeseia sp.]
MDWGRVEGNWSNLRGELQEKWGNIREDRFNQIAGQRTQLVSELQQTYGISENTAEREVDEWADSLDRRGCC